jgi:hypothetical protein
MDHLLNLIRSVFFDEYDDPFQSQPYTPGQDKASKQLEVHVSMPQPHGYSTAEYVIQISTERFFGEYADEIKRRTEHRYHIEIKSRNQCYHTSFVPVVKTFDDLMPALQRAIEHTDPCLRDSFANGTARIVKAFLTCQRYQTAIDTPKSIMKWFVSETTGDGWEGKLEIFGSGPAIVTCRSTSTFIDSTWRPCWTNTRKITIVMNAIRKIFEYDLFARDISRHDDFMMKIGDELMAKAFEPARWAQVLDEDDSRAMLARWT